MSKPDISIAVSKLGQRLLTIDPWLPVMSAPAGEENCDMYPKDALGAVEKQGTKSKFFTNLLIRDHCIVIHKNNFDLSRKSWGLL